MLKRLMILMMALVLGGPVLAQSGPLRLTITDGVIEPLPFAVPIFEAENAEAGQVAADISRLVAQDLAGTGLFREIPSSAFISTQASFAQPVAYPDWRAINAQALITGAVFVLGNQITVKFRLYDVFSGAEMGGGLQFVGTVDGWRRMGHKVADAATAVSLARVATLTAALFMWPRLAPKITVKSALLLWITMVRT
jgi:TolB protein